MKKSREDIFTDRLTEILYRMKTFSSLTDKVNICKDKFHEEYDELKILMKEYENKDSSQSD